MRLIAEAGNIIIQNGNLPQETSQKTSLLQVLDSENCHLSNPFDVYMDTSDINCLFFVCISRFCNVGKDENQLKDLG